MSQYDQNIDMFDLESVTSILKNRNYQEIVLQFVDIYLPLAVDIYQCLQNALPHAHFHITADSTWGSSADDISAQHVKAEVLVFFGSDLSSSSSIPVMVVPEVKFVDLAAFEREIFFTANPISDILLLYEPSFYHAALKISVSHSDSVFLGRLPTQADLHNWDDTQRLSSDELNVGGLFVPQRLLNKGDIRIVFIGEKESQLQNIFLRLSSTPLYQFVPSTSTVNYFLGTHCSALTERYGGIHKVENAKVVGIILGSMGIDGTRTQKLICRLEKLVAMAGKKSYTFVMGRINEAKLCNFPEVDIFCLISNDDVGMIKPRTFHVPVVTPYELEVGLKATAWESILAVGIDEILETNIDQAILNVRAESGMEETISQAPEGHLSSFLSETSSNQDMIVFESAAAEYFHNRTFKGLSAENKTAHDVTIHMGQIGTATNYENLITLN